MKFMLATLMCLYLLIVVYSVAYIAGYPAPLFGLESIYWLSVSAGFQLTHNYIEMEFKQK